MSGISDEEILMITVPKRTTHRCRSQKYLAISVGERETKMSSTNNQWRRSMFVTALSLLMKIVGYFYDRNQ